MKRQGCWEQRRKSHRRHSHHAPRRPHYRNRRERDELEAQKYSLHLRNLPAGASKKEIELWLCRTAQLCLNCTNSDGRLYGLIDRVFKMPSKKLNSSSIHLQLRHRYIKQAIMQHLKDEEFREKLQDFYGDQSVIIEIKDFEPRFVRQLQRQTEPVRKTPPPSQESSSKEESVRTDTGLNTEI